MVALREIKITPHGLARSRLEATIPAGTIAAEMNRVRKVTYTHGEWHIGIE